MSGFGFAHTRFCHLCGWFHSPFGADPHPVLRDPTCDACYSSPFVTLVGEIAEAPKLVGIQATVVGEQASPFGMMKVEDVPLAAGVDLARLKLGDTDPLEVVVAVPAAKSTRGWNYLPSAIESICKQVAEKTAPGYMGHVDPAEMDRKFTPPATHWIGAKWDAAKGIGYLRGVVDASATDLKRWIRSGRITTTSIFGEPKFGPNKKDVEVVDYALVSNDWTPLGRAGMPTEVVAYGEFDIGPGNGRKEGEKMILGEMLAEMRKDRVQAAQVIGEMGWRQPDVLEALGVKTLEDVAVTVEKERFERLKAHDALFGEMASALGLDPAKATPADLTTAFTGVLNEQKAATKAAREERLKKVVGEMITGQGEKVEAARAFVIRFVSVPDNADEAKTKEVVGEMLKEDTVRKILGDAYVVPVPHGQTDRNGGASGEQAAAGSGSGATSGAVPAGLRKSTTRL